MIKKFFEYNSDVSLEDLEDYFLDAIDNGIEFGTWIDDTQSGEESMHNFNKEINTNKYCNLIYPRLSIEYEKSDYEAEGVFKSLQKSNLQILYLFPTRKDVHFIEYNKFIGTDILSQIHNSLGVKLIWISRKNEYIYEKYPVCHIDMVFGSEKN